MTCAAVRHDSFTDADRLNAAFPLCFDCGADMEVQCVDDAWLTACSGTLMTVDLGAKEDLLNLVRARSRLATPNGAGPMRRAVGTGPD